MLRMDGVDHGRVLILAKPLLNSLVPAVFLVPVRM